MNKHTKIFENLKDFILSLKTLYKDYINIVIYKDYKILGFVIAFKHFINIEIDQVKCHEIAQNMQKLLARKNLIALTTKQLYIYKTLLEERN